MKMQKEKENKYIKNMVVELVKDHRKNCLRDCNIQLYPIYLWLTKKGLEFTEEEMSYFI